MVRNIRDYILYKLFFPKTIVIDSPGVIISKTARWYGSSSNRKRMVFHFEDIVANLQSETIKRLGKKKTSELFYKIGKDVGTRHMLIAKAKRPPSFLLHSVINHIFNVFAGSGISLAKKVTYKDKKLVLEGSDSVLCRKTGNPDCSCGLVSAVMSFLLGENIECESQCRDCPNSCRIVAEPGIRKKYIPDMEELRIMDNYNEINFPQIPSEHIRKMHSLNDFLQFKKLQIDKEGKHVFQDKAIMPSESGFAELFAKNYVEINQKEILEEAVKEGAKKIAGSVLDHKRKRAEKLEAMKNMLCAFGWGIPYYLLDENKIMVSFIYAPITRHGFLYKALVVNGFLDSILNKNFRIKSLRTIPGLNTVQVEYHA